MVKILSDSTCDLTKDLLARYDIDIIPLHILLGEEEYEDGLNITPDEIFTWSDEHNTTPKTSAPSIETAIDRIQPYLENDGEVIIFTISEDMSTSANVMRMAAEELDAVSKVHVINSQNLSTGIGLLVIEAAIMAQNGMPASAIVDRIDELIPKVRASFVVDTLVYLHRGGRCSSVSALLGSALKLHPRINVSGGKMAATQKYRGKIDKVILTYANDLEKDLLKAKKDRVFITHSGCDADVVESVRNYLNNLKVFDEVLETRAGGVISSHCGPGTLGVLFIDGE